MYSVGRESLGTVSVLERETGSGSLWSVGSSEALEVHRGVLEPDLTVRRNKGANFGVFFQGVRWAGSGEVPSPVAGRASSAGGS